MPKPSPKSAIELSQEISSDIICDWWRLIHSGWKHPIDYLHGGMICCSRELHGELQLLHQVGTLVHETTLN